jgi:hypothetical protein
VSLKPGDTRASASISPDASVARSKADGLSSSGRMSRVMLTRPVPLVMITSWCNVACSCCSSSPPQSSNHRKRKWNQSSSVHVAYVVAFPFIVLTQVVTSWIAYSQAWSSMARGLLE